MLHSLRCFLDRRRAANRENLNRLLDRATIDKPGHERRNLIRVKAAYFSHGTFRFRKKQPGTAALNLLRRHIKSKGAAIRRVA
jgi:hypothetical protein